jgi:hypothetical protein
VFRPVGAITGLMSIPPAAIPVGRSVESAEEDGEGGPVGSAPDLESARTVEAGPRHSGPGDAPGGRRHVSRLLVTFVGLILVLILVIALLISRHGTAGNVGDPGNAGPLPNPVQPAGQVPPHGGPAGVKWHLQFDETFSEGKDALLQSGVWHAGWFGDGRLTDKVNGEETALFASDNLSVAGGVARLTVTPNVRNAALEDGTTEPNLGAALNSDESQATRGFMMTYGYVEARMQLPAAPVDEHVWPSFWLNGENWPDDMEIDVVEGDGTDHGNKFNIHYGSNNNDTTNLNDVHRQRTVPGATTGWHTYGAEIRPDGVTFYYDGKAVYTYRGQVPDAPRYLMLGASTSARVTAPRSLLVDYVRAWTRAG